LSFYRREKLEKSFVIVGFHSVLTSKYLKGGDTISMQRMIKAREYPAVILGSGCMLSKYWMREHV